MAKDYNSQIINSTDILFTGAGASQPLGYALMNDFMDGVKGRLSPEENAILENIRMYETPQMPWPDLELVLATLAKYEETLRFLRKDPLWQGAANQVGYRDHMPTLEDKIRDAIFDEYGRIPTADVESLFRPLFDFFFKQCSLDFLPVFTTNYDRSIEVYRDKVGCQLELGFDVASADPMWDPDRIHSFEPDGRRRPIVCLKLHGSVTWYKTLEGVRYIQLSKRNIPDHENMVIYPGEAKGSPEDPFYTCYTYLQLCLRSARRVWIIGYSFRDAVLDQLFREALQENDDLHFIVLNGEISSAEIERITTKLGGPSNCHVVPHRFVSGRRAAYLNVFKLDLIRLEKRRLEKRLKAT